MKKFATLFLGSAGILACQVETSEPTGLEESVVSVSEAIRVGDYYWPPRCGPRNCEAMCVTCGYDQCRHFGGSQVECREEMELCKDECYPNTCVPGDPGCPCSNPTDPHCF